MENLFTKFAILIARFMVVGFFTLVYVTPLYLLFYLIIFQNTELLSEISVKSYSIAYLIGFIINYINTMNLLKKDEKTINKGFQR
jgi:putative flippase GtrA